MKKVYNCVFIFCFVSILIGFAGMYATKYAIHIDFNYAMASSGAAATFNSDLKVAFIKEKNSICVYDLKTGREMPVKAKFTEIKSVALNRAQNKLIAAGTQKDLNGVYTIDIASGAASAVVEKKGVIYNSPSFSADGKMAAYIQSFKDDPFTPSNIMVYDFEKKSETNLTNQKETNEINVYYNFPKFSEDSKKIIYSKANIPDIDTPRYDSIYICSMSSSGSGEVTIAGGSTVFDEKGNQSGFKASAPSVIANGKIGFLKTVANTEKSIAVLNADKPEEISELLTGVENMAMPSFSFNGEYIAFEIFTDGPDAANHIINVYEVSSKTTKKISGSGNCPSF